MNRRRSRDTAADARVAAVEAQAPTRPVGNAAASPLDNQSHTALSNATRVDLNQDFSYTPRDHQPNTGLVGDTIWGATAAMLHQLLTLLLPAAEG